MSIGLDSNPSTSVLDSDLIKSLKWRGSAPKKLMKAAATGDLLRFVIAYRAWLEPAASRFRKHLRGGPLSLVGRSQPGTLARLVDEYTSAEGRFRNGFARAIVGWLHGPAANPMSSSELITALELLLNPPIDLEAEAWFRLWRNALAVASQPEPGKPTFGVTTTTEAALLQSLFFEPLGGATKLNKNARRQIEEDLLAATDTDGMPHAEVLRGFSQLFSTLVRCGWWGRAFRCPTLNGKGSDRFDGLTIRATELCRRDGSFVFNDTTARDARSLLPLAVRLGELPKKSDVRQFALSFESEEWKPLKSSSRSPASQSDWAGVACLRSGRSRDADFAVVTLDETVPRIEIGCLGTSIVSGPWETKAVVDGKAISPRGEWSCSCWFSDEDGDYLELESSVGRVRFERQAYLSRKEHFLLLTDCVQTSSNKAVSAQSRIKLSPQMMSRADFVSREWRLHTGQMPVRVFPVSLEFDRVQHAMGQCSVDGDVLSLDVDGERNVVGAVVLDWHPQRSELDAEWVPLTVTESRQFVPRSLAHAFRVRVGQQQLVYYRNTSDSTLLRTVLGQHVKHETVIGSLGKSGVFDPLVLVEHAADEDA